MTFERKKIRGEQLEQLVALVEPLIQDLDLDFPIRIDDSLLVDEERGIYHFLRVVGFYHLLKKLSWKKRDRIILMVMKITQLLNITGQPWKLLLLPNKQCCLRLLNFLWQQLKIVNLIMNSIFPHLA